MEIEIGARAAVHAMVFVSASKAGFKPRLGFAVFRLFFEPSSRVRRLLRNCLGAFHTLN